MGKWLRGSLSWNSRLVSFSFPLFPTLAIHGDKKPTITRLSSTLSNQKVSMHLASVSAHLHKGSLFENRTKPVTCRTTQWRINCVFITIMQSSIPELLTATKHKLPMWTPPYLSAQKLTVLQQQSLLVKQLNVMQITIILYSSLRFATEQSWIMVLD